MILLPLWTTICFSACSGRVADCGGTDIDSRGGFSPQFECGVDLPKPILYQFFEQDARLQIINPTTLMRQMLLHLTWLHRRQ